MWGERPEEHRGPAAQRPRADAGILAELERMLEPIGPRVASSQVWEDGRPKGWPTLQLRIRAKPFDIYCEHPTDVTLDGIGMPVINGHTVGREDLARGWFSSR